MTNTDIRVNTYHMGEVKKKKKVHTKTEKVKLKSAKTTANSRSL